MVVIYYSAVRAQRNIYSGFFKVFISCLGNLYDRCSLPATYTLLFSCYAYGAAAYTYFYKIGTALCKITESLFVYNISRTHFDAVSILGSYKIYRLLLPFGISLGRIYTKNVCSRFDKRGDSFFKITSVYSGTDYISFIAVQKLIRIGFM